MKMSLRTLALMGLLAIGSLGGLASPAHAEWRYNPYTATWTWAPPGLNQYQRNEMLERQLTGGRDIPDPGDAIYNRPQPTYNPNAYNQYLRNELLERQVTGGRDIPDTGDAIFRPY